MTRTVLISAPAGALGQLVVQLVDDLFAGQTRRVPSLHESLERICIDPARMQGLPCIRGTRVTVSAVLGQLAAGRSIDDVIEDYPQLERADVLGALEYAAAATRDREIPLTAAG